NLRVARHGRLKPLLPAYLAVGASALVAVVGAAAMIEMTYHLQLNAALGPQIGFLGATLDARSPATWTGAVAVFAVGAALFEVSRRAFARRWGATQEAIEHDMKLGAAAQGGRA
ncbi:hypothetical protein, partial [Salmonella enterica]|uniref:hypothetical protein n=1 Tax=Salmonella enterica TaxID=28901 RepID=UPI0035286326